jgi:voltage-gated potassium channel
MSKKTKEDWSLKKWRDQGRCTLIYPGCFLSGIISEVKPSRLGLSKEIAMVLLAILSTGLLIFEITSSLTPAQTRLFTQIDIAISLLFFLDFANGYLVEKNKKTFWKERWWEVFTFIPFTDTTLIGLRSLRVLRALRITRAIARIKRVGDMAFDGPSFKLFSIALTLVSLVFAGSVAFYSVENGINPNIHSLFDSFWYAIVTVTTIGYGDIYPVTTEGRLVAIFLMLTGIGSLGLAATTIAGSITVHKEKFVKQQK